MTILDKKWISCSFLVIVSSENRNVKFHWIGFSDQLLETNERLRGAKVFWNDRLYSVPRGFQLMAPARFWPLLTSGLLSPLGKLRMMCEPFVGSLPGGRVAVHVPYHVGQAMLIVGLATA